MGHDGTVVQPTIRFESLLSFISVVEEDVLDDVLV